MSSTTHKPSPPLAGKPPFATDEPDSFYETPRISPTQRIRAQLVPPAATANSDARNKRTSAYDVYDSYLAADASTSKDASRDPFAAPQDAGANRNSGVGAMLLNMGSMDSDSDSDDDDDDDRRRTRTNPGAGGNGNKNATLAAAVSTSAAARAAQGTPQPSQSQSASASPPSPQRIPKPIAAPQPGYPAPIAALNLAQSFTQAPQPQHQPQPQMRQIPMPAPLRITVPPPLSHSHPHSPNQNPFDPSPHAHLQNPFDPLPAPPHSPFVRPDSTSPHPLLPPITPITPAFVRPAKRSAPPPPASISFDEAALHGGAGRGTGRERPIMRGDDEETLLPSRGEKGDDFWRRFSMVAKLDSAPKGAAAHPRSTGRGKGSAWLAQTEGRTAAYARWVWAVGLTLLLIVVGAIALGVYATRGAPAHQPPKAFGGSADQAATYSSDDGGMTRGGKIVSGPGGVSTVLHVSPTNTVARRAPEPTAGVVWMVGHAHGGGRRRLESGMW